ncbi:MFS general substrate transporter [Lophiostoma macrostomum CBS 122681]|uniref:MFS general substrate transporter n=1 Tax=Lophiostoma macrostomum CBS 122681 TaxID=1314788 RepID=A0A6A6TAZ0_9PLEO|nr:MFS general substrate transporter [Lophiostoma macrostomum CBS 122681]
MDHEKVETTGESPEGDAEIPALQESPTYPTSLRLWIIALTCSLSGFLSGLDQTILATAIPKITNDFHTLTGISWWTSSYLLTSATFQLFFGRCNTVFSVKYVYMTANAMFGLGSIICASAPTSVALIVGRTIAGIGVAGIMSGNVLIVAASAPLERRASITGMMFAFLGIASVIGPFVGGALTDRATWRWCFGLNVPISACIILSTSFFVQTPQKPDMANLGFAQKMSKFDMLGTILLTVSFFCLIFALQLGGTGSWNEARVVALFVVAGVLFLIFLGWQHISKQSTIPAVKDRNVWLASMYAGFISGGMFVTITYLPVWFQAVRGASAFRSGVMMTPLVTSFVVMSIISGVVTEVIGYYNPSMIFGVILAAIGAGLLTVLEPSSGHTLWIGFQVLYGFGAGAGVPPPMLVVQTVLSGRDVAMGVAVVSLTQMLSSSIFVAIAQPVFESELRKGIAHALPDIQVGDIVSHGARDLANTFSADQLARLVPAYSEALVKVFFITTALSCAALPCCLALPWRSMKAKSAEENVSETRKGSEAVQA